MSASAEIALVFNRGGTALLRTSEHGISRLPCAACAQPDQVLALAKSRVHRELIADERKQYHLEG